ncbi:hypothetical protein PMAYCL1PPCAC_24006 [Pristionchus mayeri]|uniref:Endoplasmic reticulum lectin 1 n=1 Tax=Pristionchus mayeri TaxID=1317129 RepID=A0AAN5CZ60_9BILA|nr:hypothetical protein PMAYCL1PPCAC_24006 [Pristionchus mayeri]
MMIRLKATLSLLPLLTTAFFADDSIHHSIEYTIPDDTSTLLQYEDETHVVVRTRYQEQYTCAMPQSNKELFEDSNSYNGPTPWELIAPLKERNICTIRVDPFWSYEVCHGKYVRQFHDSKDEKLSFYLGNFHPNYISLDYEKWSEDKIKVNGEDLPYLPVLYSQGTSCDLTGQPRMTRVLYVCYHTQREVIESITEVSTCKYDVVVLTQLICAHPRFRGANPQMNTIVCTSHKKQSDPIPKSYIPLATAQKAAFHASYAPTFDRVLKPSDSASMVDLTELYTQMERNHGFKKQAEIRFDSSAFNQILSGSTCLDSGGLDYWRYEYCHLNKIVQYHEISATNRREVLLGAFNKERHLKYLRDNPAKRPNKFDGKVVQVVHYYSGGMKCGEGSENNFQREVEVRFRCSTKRSDEAIKSPREDLHFSVTEPSMCSYIITLESERLCETIQRADYNGLF